MARLGQRPLRLPEEQAAQTATSRVIEAGGGRRHPESMGHLHPLLIPLAVSALIGAGWAGVRGARLLARGLRAGEDPAAPLWVIRGFRGLIVAICLVALAAGTLLGARWLIVVAALWLAEEIYETGVLALILRSDQPGPERSRPA